MADEKPSLHIDTDWKRHAQEEKKKLAYAIWEREGVPTGRDVEHYYRAERILRTHGEIRSQTDGDSKA